MVSTNIPIGIDLGTTSSCVGIWRDRGGIYIIPNEQNNRTTPTCVNFSSDGRLIGDAARNRADTKPANTIFGVKRIIGRAFSDSSVQADIRRLPYRVVDVNGRPSIEAEYRGVWTRFAPEEISAMVLRKLKQNAESRLRHPVSDAVIAVPGHFSSAQRQATRDAGTIAGLNVVRLVNEQLAIAMAYIIDKDPSKLEEHNVIVFDLGGGTLDVLLLTIDGKILQVKAISGRSDLGGDDFDNKLVDHFVQEFGQKYGKNISNDPRALRRLRTACERAKRNLSTSNQALLEIDALFQGKDFYTKLDRNTFETLCHDLLRATLVPVERVLQDAQIKKKGVQKIILAGGSTRIPFIGRMLSDYFDGRVEIVKGMNVEEAVAHGAAVLGAMLVTNGNLDKLQDLVAIDILSKTIGIETAASAAPEVRPLKDSVDGGGVMTRVIKKNSPIPTLRSQKFTTHFNNQNRVLIHVFEGESDQTKENDYLGTMELTSIPPGPRWGVPIQIRIDIDEDYGIVLSAECLQFGLGNKKVLKSGKCLGQREMDEIIQNAARYEADDALASARIAAKNSFEEFLFSLQGVIDEAQSWLEMNQEASQDEYVYKYREIAASIGHIPPPGEVDASSECRPQ